MLDMAPLLFIGAIVAIIVFRIVRYGGFKASLFGARIAATVGELEVGKQGPFRQRIRVHVLQGNDSVERKIGFELTQSAVMSWHMTPLSLSLDEARRLSDLLGEAIRTWPAGP